MTVEEFAHQLIEEVKPLLPDRLRDADLTVQSSKEPSHTGFTGIYIWPKDSDVAPCYYIDQQYAYFCEGMPIQDIAADLVGAIISHEALEQELDNTVIEDFEKAKENIVAILMDGREGRNEKYLVNRPWMPFGQSNIKIVFAIQFPIQSSEIVMVLPITTDLMDFWQTTPLQLQQYAIENGPKIRPAVMTPLHDLVLKPKDRINTKASIMVLTNSDDSQGAAVLLYKDTPAMLEKEFPEGYYLIPSSIHEWIVVDRTVFDDPMELLRIVKTHNQQKTADQNILAEDVFEIKEGLLISATKKGAVYA